MRMYIEFSDHASEDVTVSVRNVSNRPRVSAGDSSRQRPAYVFMCYAHDDDIMRNSLHNHLGGLCISSQIEIWDDEEISPGKEWKPEIIRKLDEADIILLLVTASFTGSTFIRTVELERALERHRRGEAVVIPVILKPVDWRTAGLGGLQALPTGGMPVSAWPNADDAYLDIAEGVGRAVAAWRGR